MQTRKHSLIETTLNISSGFVISLAVWEFCIEPLYGIEKGFVENMGITFIFTVISLVRGYVWRRLFNGREK